MDALTLLFIGIGIAATIAFFIVTHSHKHGE
jgi:hypothetical protein